MPQTGKLPPLPEVAADLPQKLSLDGLKPPPLEAPGLDPKSLAQVPKPGAAVPPPAPGAPPEVPAPTLEAGLEDLLKAVDGAAKPV
jgi:hypothetical protein